MKTLSPTPTRADACTASAKRTGKAIAKPSRKTRFPFPDLPEAGENIDFWLSAWARNAAKLEAMMAFIRLPTTQQSIETEVLHLALICSESKLKEAADISLEHLRNTGGLLFAFPESTRFTAPGGAA